jgi:hypothetical protein
MRVFDASIIIKRSGLVSIPDNSLITLIWMLAHAGSVPYSTRFRRKAAQYNWRAESPDLNRLIVARIVSASSIALTASPDIIMRGGDGENERLTVFRKFR